MAEKTKENTNDEIKQDDKNGKKEEKKGFFSANRIEVLVAIFLGITALLTAWASWISSLHGGNQATNYTKSNNLAAEGNAEYNAGLQTYLSDLLTWNTVMDYSFDQSLAEANGNELEAQLIAAKLDNYLDQNGSPILAQAALEMTDGMSSPFEVEGMLDRYYESANVLLEQSKTFLEEGQKDNSNGDAYNLVSVIYSLVLFLLGIVGIFKGIPNRAVVLIIAIIGLILTTIYMITIPLPTGFSLGSYFGG
ncbi:MAG: hypothetical protein IKP88_18205 [Lachnospiraceae bacterium]|nr:hypothetical protein [Lachnospiraceae bacterium]